MEGAPYSSNCADKEYVSKNKSNLSLSGGDFPHEDSVDWSDTTSSEDSTSEASFCYFFSPVQESWVTECGRMPPERREQIPDDSEQLDELPIVRVVDVHLGSHYEGSLATFDLCGDYQRKDKDPQERISQRLWKLEGLMPYLQAFLEDLKDDEDDDSVFSDSTLDEDLESSTSASSCRYLIVCQEHDSFEDFPDWKVQENEDIISFVEISPRQEDELVEVSMELPDLRSRDRHSAGVRWDSMDSVILPAEAQVEPRTPRDGQ